MELVNAVVNCSNVLHFTDGYYVVTNRDGACEIVTSWMTTDPSTVIATFKPKEPTISFNPMTMYVDGRLEQIEENSRIAKENAHQYLLSLS